jgi:MraZ protein
MGTPALTPLFYSGEYRHALDPKNRVTIPSKWRPKQGETEELFLIPDPSGTCLLVLPREEFEAVGERVSASDVSPKEQRVFIRQFYSRAKSSAVDKQGRLLLPEDFCRQLDLAGEVVLAGGRVRFEVWNAAKWDRNTADVSETYTKVADLVGL